MVETVNRTVARRRSRAGCLFELTIAAFVLAVLAAIAVPDFLKFQARAKCGGEQRDGLARIYSLQMAYSGEHGKFAAGPNCFELLGWKPEVDTNYNYYCGSDRALCTRPGCRQNACAPDQFPSDPAPASSDRGFTIHAVGNIDRDTGDCDVWSINDAKVLRHERNDIGE